MKKIFLVIAIACVAFSANIFSDTHAQNQSEEPGTEKLRDSSDKETGDFFQHPLVILLAGSIISGILIPFFTKSWQNHQKSLDIKNDLVSEVSKTVTTMMINIQYFFRVKSNYL